MFIQNFGLILLATAFTFSPELNIGKIEGGRLIFIRAEDVLLVLLGLLWIANILVSRRTTIKSPPLFLPIISLLGISSFSVLTNLIFGNIEIARGFFYFLKEIEFFAFYFYIFYHIKGIDSAKFIINFWIILCAGAILLILFQFADIVPKYGTYGPSLFMERGPLPSGGFFLILFTNLFNTFLYYYSSFPGFKIRKGIIFLTIILLSMGIVASGSRTALLGFAIVLFLSIFLYQLKRGEIKRLSAISLTFLFIGISFIIISKDVFRSADITPTRLIYSLWTVRIQGIWVPQLETFSYNPFTLLFGMGKSVLLTGEESHSQYVRNFIETGFVGSVAFLTLIFAIMKKTWKSFAIGKNPLLVGVASGTLISTLAMLVISIPAEAFITVRVAQVYWFFTALSMAVLSTKGVA